QGIKQPIAAEESERYAMCERPTHDGFRHRPWLLENRYNCGRIRHGRNSTADNIVPGRQRKAVPVIAITDSYNNKRHGCLRCRSEKSSARAHPRRRRGRKGGHYPSWQTRCPTRSTTCGTPACPARGHEG